ncbi:S8 family serine peptidase [Roseomonas stagni]|uniref:S8 family serine peptidase n=1 Tax=Falsiroseomonas algicola TaxID=2716930 RepID=A0A6M1LU24_9PROT|nr:S8 family serine peptidase [Falsiroseomonas algicola]NGM23985.1 S8 family serine peptidase [Falsiroseomonas algicola]
MRLLVQTRPGAGRLRLQGLAARPLEVALRPLMPATAAAGGEAMGFAAGAAPAWHVTGDLPERANPWDACHMLLREGLGFGAGSAVAFAEPDIEWSTPDHDDPPRTSPGGNPQRADHPRGPGDNWFLRREFSGLAAAREELARHLGAQKPATRLAHFDTGFDASHTTCPLGLRPDLARNFVERNDEGGPAHEALDRADGTLSNPGHGTATLAILAGSKYGGAHGFEVAPFRVCPRVVLVRTSALAEAMDTVLGWRGDAQTRCDVVSMSMGGLASKAWADAANALYEAGVVVVTAAGNNFGGLPVESVVFPARFRRVLAVAGIRADGSPYADLPVQLMAGCYGPASKMRTALAAWTPNIPWARRGAGAVVDQDGGGTSAATPQVAAAAALWLERYAAALAAMPGWRRVEAVRHALFSAAAQPAQGNAPHKYFGRGVLDARAALDLPPRADVYAPEEADTARFAALRLLTGFGVVAAGSRAEMLEIEATQLAQRSPAAREALDGHDPDDPAGLPSAVRRRVVEALAGDPLASVALKAALREALPAPVGGAAPAVAEPAPAPARTAPARNRPAGGEEMSAVAPPAHRRLRIFAIDPTLAAAMDTRDFATDIVAVPWEAVQPGPVGEYIEVIDIDAASGLAYAPVNLSRPEVLAQDGLVPSEGSPQFHQQMAYAVAMRTVDVFRRALGRTPFWAERVTRDDDGAFRRGFVRRLRIYPHAIREANAYYSPARRALLFGYFRAQSEPGSQVLRDGMVFTCLSHDIVAHETSHALLDGLHPRWREAANPEAFALHEAFSDLVALFQHFTMPRLIAHEIRRAKGRPGIGSALGKLARQFGEAVGQRGALRDALGTPPKPTDFQEARHKGEHALGEVLVAAVFDGFLRAYNERADGLFRLASNGTGVLPPGEIPDELAERLAQEAATVAGHFLRMCVRALDYCPPVEPTFGEYLRALITADCDLVPDDRRGYRVALIDGFRKRGIRPPDVETWSPTALVWGGPLDPEALAPLREVIAAMSARWRLDGDRLAAWQASRDDARTIKVAIDRLPDAPRKALCQELGLLDFDDDGEPVGPGGRRRAGEVEGPRGTFSSGTFSRIEVHSVRPARRVGPDGELLADTVIEITQRWWPQGSDEFVRGGCTIIWDRERQAARYVVSKRVGHPKRTKEELRLRAKERETAETSGYVGGAALADADEPFALLHGRD